jgi:hypothetical protein
MCSPVTLSAVEIVIGEMVRQRRSFTGQDVYQRIYQKGITRKTKDADAVEQARQENENQGTVSREVRNMFNGKSALFTNYGSYPIPHPTGPVMYFPLPAHAKRATEKILKKMSSMQLQSSLPPSP